MNHNASITVFVTGASGFLGRHVVYALRAKGHPVVAMVRPASVNPFGDDPGVEVVRADLREPRMYSECLRKAEVLVHLAAAVTGSEDAQFQAAVTATEKLLDAAKGSSVRRVVLASSLSVYDWENPSRKITEQTELARAPGLYLRDGYAIAKSWQERVAREACREQQIELVVLRPGFLVGRGHEDCSGIGQRIGPLYCVFGPLRRLPVSAVQNAASAFVSAVDDPSAAGKDFNVYETRLPRAWSYARWLVAHEKRTGGRLRLTIPIPYLVASLLPWCAGVASRVLFGPGGKLPSLLVGPRFRARFRPVKFGPNQLGAQIAVAGGVKEQSLRDAVFGASLPTAVGSSADSSSGQAEVNVSKVGTVAGSSVS
jgi:nucleoside-diphosphate-sugar epimerase